MFRLRRGPGSGALGGGGGGAGGTGGPGGAVAGPLVEVVVNVSGSERDVTLDDVHGEAAVLFTTPAGATLRGSTLTLPPHAGALLSLGG